MVSTRHHPSEFSTPTSSPSTSQPLTAQSPTPRRARSANWSHTPSNLTLIWLAISLPLVAWDTVYVLFRPHTMPGGALHWPLYVPYKLYGEVDHGYGWPAYTARDGWTGAQGTVNLLETIGYGVYLWMALRAGREVNVKGRGAPSGGVLERIGLGKGLGRARALEGREAGWAVLLGFAVACVTASKTLLYFLNEILSGFKHIGHNSAPSLIFLWILPNGFWLTFPPYMAYVFGCEILEGLEMAADGNGRKKRA